MNKPALYLQLSHLERQDFWVNEYPGVYFVRLSDLLYPNFEVEYLSDLTAENISAVINVIYDNIFLNQVSSIAACIVLQSSFYSSGTVVYIHCPGNNDPYNHILQLGAAFQYRKGGSQYDDGQDTDELLLSVPNINKSISDIFNSKVIFSGGNADLNNGSGIFDLFLEDEEIIGNKARLIIKHPVTSVKSQLFTGFIEGGTLTKKKLSLSIKDDKQSLNIPIPLNKYNLIDFPELNLDNVDKPIPIGFGNIYNAPMICSNETGTTPFYFICADRDIAEIHDIDEVLVDGVPVAFTKDLANNRFLLAGAVYAPGQTVTASYQGYENSDGNLMRNACDILKFLFIIFFNFSDSSNFFATWDTVHALNIYFFINEIKKFWEVVEQICKDSFLNLILNGNGTYSAIVNDRDGYFLREIRNYEVMESGDIDYDSSKILSSVLVKYKKNYADGTWLQKLVNDNETVIHDIYNQYSYKELEANLDNETDARHYGLIILDYFSSAYKTFKIKMDYFEASDLVLGLNYKINLSRPQSPALGDCVVKVISISENLNTFVTELTLRIIEKIPHMVDSGATMYSEDTLLSEDELFTSGYMEVIA